MHKTGLEARQFIQELKPALVNKNVGVWLAVPFTAIEASAQAAQGSLIQIGAQNVSDHVSGALTGEVSCAMVHEAGASFVVLGHSERRRLFKEDDEMIHRKVKLALDSGLKVIICIGETEEERQAGHAELILTRQMAFALKDISPKRASQIVFAYEPVWAIGSSQPASPEIVEEIHALCKNRMASDWGLPKSHCHVLYGGSVNAENACHFLKLPSVDGLLVGGASLGVQSFLEIIHQAGEPQ